METKKLNLLFIGDIFGVRAIDFLAQQLPSLIQKWEIDFVIAQGENVSGRKGLIKSDYEKLKKAGIHAITLGNHIWAKKNIKEIIENDDLIRPYNVNKNMYPGQGTRIFTINNIKLRITSLLGITFNDLIIEPTGWQQNHANNFFDAFDEINKLKPRADFHIIDFHAETTSEKNVFAIYIDGKADALVGTHTHVQTNDARILPNGLAYITDAGMTGPKNAAIGADFDSVYQKMRFDKKSTFEVSNNPLQFNGVVIQLNLAENEKKHKIIPINF